MSETTDLRKMERMNRTNAQVVRLAIWTPVALFLLGYTISTEGSAYTWGWLRFLAVSVVVAVTVAKLAKLM